MYDIVILFRIIFNTIFHNISIIPTKTEYMQKNTDLS